MHEFNQMQQELRLSEKTIEEKDETLKLLTSEKEALKKTN